MTDFERALTELGRATRQEISTQVRPTSGAMRRIRVRRTGALLVSGLAVSLLVLGGTFIPSLLRSDTVAPPNVGAAASPYPLTPRANGRIAYSYSGGAVMQLRTMEPDGTSEKVIPTPQGEPWAHSWSPDGTKLAVTIFGAPAERSIWIMNEDGSDAIQVAAADNVSEASWTPDGRNIIYAASGGSSSEIRMVQVDGAGERVLYRPKGGSSEIFSAQVSPDGTRILFDAGTDSGFDIFSIGIDGRGLRQVTDTGTDYEPHWSPDGNQIAFTRQEIVNNRATSDVFVMDADGSSVRQLTQGGERSTNMSANWSPDGTKIVYQSGITGGPGGVVVLDADGSHPRELVPAEVLAVSWQPLPVVSEEDETLGDEILHDEPIPRRDAVNAVLDRVDLEVPPRDLSAKLGSPPRRFSGVEQAWRVRSRTAGFVGWVDAETGEVLDVILDDTIDLM